MKSRGRQIVICLPRCLLGLSHKNSPLMFISETRQ
jgi:hypothetical protein